MMATMTMEAMTATTTMSAMVRRMVAMDGGAGFPDEDVQVSSRARALEVGGDARVRRALDDVCALELLAGEVLALLVRRDVRRACMMSSMCPRWGEGLAPPAALMMMRTRVRRASWARAGRSGGRSSSGPLAAAGRSSLCRSCTRKFTRGTFRAGLMPPPAGTRRFLAEVASRWCTSDRRCRQCHQATASGRAGALGTSTKPTDDTSFEPQVQVFTESRKFVYFLMSIF